MCDRWANSIRPGAAIGCSRRGKRRSAELLGVKPEWMFLRRVLALRQSAGNGFRGKLISKAGLIPDLIGHASSPFTSVFCIARLSASCMASYIWSKLSPQTEACATHPPLPESRALRPAKIRGQRNGPQSRFAFAMRTDQPAAVNLDFVSLANQAKLHRVPEQPSQLFKYSPHHRWMRKPGRTVRGILRRPY